MCMIKQPKLSLIIWVKAQIKNVEHFFAINCFDYIEVLINKLYVLCKSNNIRIFVTHDASKPNPFKTELQIKKAHFTKIYTLGAYCSILDGNYVLHTECSFIKNKNYYLACVYNYIGSLMSK